MWKNKRNTFLSYFLFSILSFTGIANSAVLNSGPTKLTLPQKQNPVYTLKIYFDTKTTDNSIKRYDNNTQKFLKVLTTELKTRLINWLLSQNVELFLNRGLGTDYTITLTFPEVYIWELIQKKETNTGVKNSFGYKIRIVLALYVFKSSVNPTLEMLKTYTFDRYFPPKGEYLPLFTSLATPIADSFFLNIKRDLASFIKQQQEILQYYKNLVK
ncbi:MAG: hypothetical protein GXN97_04400 [Aquificae bacterium]|nr:hypothetical protein [Aquificota bacterium]